MSNETKHTPGPWAVDENGLAGYGDNGPNFYIVTENGSRHGDYIAVLSLEHRLTDNGRTKRYLEAAATARLIAAAPEMFDALKPRELRQVSILLIAAGMDDAAHALDKIADAQDAAISKATLPSTGK